VRSGHSTGSSDDRLGFTYGPTTRGSSPGGSDDGIDSLDEGPVTVAGIGESIVVLEPDSNAVSSTDGSDDPTDITAREETEADSDEGTGGK
jgi:hypothetical protein